MLHSILSSDLFVLYSISGMGKTSLLNAGVFEGLRERGFWPVIVRLNDPGAQPPDLIDAQLRAAAEHSEEIEAIRAPEAAESQTTLWDLLEGLEVWKRNALLKPILVFDQFEELFSLDWDPRTRQRFITELGEVVRRHRGPTFDGGIGTPPPNVKVVIVIREDWLGELEALRVDVPLIMHDRFRLIGLDPKQAENAIREPALIDDPRLQTQRFTYSEDAARTLIDFLRTKEERGQHLPTSSIEPPQLQIICQHIERTILPSKPHIPGNVVQITVDDLGGQQGLGDILRDFYRSEVEAYDPHDRDRVRALCEMGLISQTSRRLSLEEGEIEAQFDVSKSQLDALVGRRLLRSEPRVGSVYYELAHDTLVEPILAYRQELDRERAERKRSQIAFLFLVIGVAVGVVAVVSGAVQLIQSFGDQSVPAAPTEVVAVQTIDLIGHTGAVSGVAFSPDGTQIATASSDDTAKVWDVASGEELITFTGHTDVVSAVAFSLDGTQIATASDDHTARLWDLESGAALSTFTGHTDWVSGVAFSPDGTRLPGRTRLATASFDGTAKVWDVGSGEELITFNGHTDGVLGVAFNADGTRIATASRDGTAKVWDVATGEELITFNGHTGQVTGVAFSPDGTQIATASSDHTAKVWDVASGEELITFAGHTAWVRGVAFSPDGTQIATASDDDTAKVWDLESGAGLITFAGHTAWVRGVAFSPDGTQIATASDDQTTKLTPLAALAAADFLGG